MGAVLQLIGFENEIDRDAIMEAGIGQFKDFRYLVEKDIRDMANEFGKRTIANGQIVFGLGRTKIIVPCPPLRITKLTRHVANLTHMQTLVHSVPILYHSTSQDASVTWLHITPKLTVPSVTYQSYQR